MENFRIEQGVGQNIRIKIYNERSKDFSPSQVVGKLVKNEIPSVGKLLKKRLAKK